MISLRRTLGAAALMGAVATMTTGCGGREGPGNNDAGDLPGCTGVCSEDGGTGDAGTQVDGGTQAGPTLLSIGEVRQDAGFGQLVRVEEVVVSAVSRASQGNKGDYVADFWVVDPDSPQDGIWVEKYYFDTPTNYRPEVGHVVSLEGYFHINSKFDDVIAYRKTLKSEHDVNKGKGLLKITLVNADAGTPSLYNEVDAGWFGDANGGLARPNPDYAGSLVHIQGPLTLTQPNPEAMRLLANTAEPQYRGFEVTGGILVHQGKTEDYTFDGGYVTRCDWRLKALEGKTVTFPNGIRGVWDTYSHAPCVDGGTNTFTCYPRLEGRVPGAVQEDGGTSRYTFVLYPQRCADLDGVIVEEAPDGGTDTPDAGE